MKNGKSGNTLTDKMKSQNKQKMKRIKELMEDPETLKQAKELTKE